jgi:hypothetical protein
MVGFRAAPYTLFPKGRNVSNFFVQLTNEVSSQTFPIWYVGDPPVRGSGLFVGKNGHADLYSFLLLDQGAGYDFVAGEYCVEVYADTVRGSRKRLFRQPLLLTAGLSNAIKLQQKQVVFVWLSNVRKYVGRVTGGDMLTIR